MHARPAARPPPPRRRAGRLMPRVGRGWEQQQLRLPGRRRQIQRRRRHRPGEPARVRAPTTHHRGWTARALTDGGRCRVAPLLRDAAQAGKINLTAIVNTHQSVPEAGGWFPASGGEARRVLTRRRSHWDHAGGNRKLVRRAPTRRGARGDGGACAWACDAAKVAGLTPWTAGRAGHAPARHYRRQGLRRRDQDARARRRV